MVLVLDALLAGRLERPCIWTGVGLGWLANFAGRLSSLARPMLSPDTTMYRFWDFAFLPLRLPPSRDDLLKSAGLLLEIFVNPLNLLAPGGSQLGVVLPLILLIAREPLPGPAVAPDLPPARRCRSAWPSSPRSRDAIPFHGRLLLELVPALFLLIAEGTEWVARRFPSRAMIVYKIVLIVLLAYPCWDACYHAVRERNRDFNIHGDLHPNVFIDIPDQTAIRRPASATGDAIEDVGGALSRVLCPRRRHSAMD